MFTALVAAVLIMTSVVLVTTMTTTEDKMGNQLYYMLNTFQLNDAAAIARSDALQSFNYNFRASMQDYLTFNSDEMDNESGFSILTTTNHDNWTEIVDTFERVILLTDADGNHNFDAVIEFVAKRTVLQFNEGSYGRYHVSLSSKDSTARQNTINALNEAIACLSPKEKFLEVVDCDADECELGTFYFNIPLDCVSPETYEALPKIVVKDLITKGETKLPILPRTRLKIYIPLRFFKAVFVARQNAEAMENADSDLRNAKLGFCDSGCTPRENPNNGTSGNWNHECPGGASSNELQDLSGEPAGLKKYNTGGGTVANIGLNAYAKQIICNDAVTHQAWETDDDDFYNISGPDYYADFPSRGVNGLEPDITGLIKIPECPFKKILASVESNSTKLISGTGAGGKLYCGKMRIVEADVGFEERNPLYIVKGESIRYKIRVTTELYASPTSGTAECVNNGTAKTCGT